MNLIPKTSYLSIFYIKFIRLLQLKIKLSCLKKIQGINKSKMDAKILFYILIWLAKVIEDDLLFINYENFN